MNRKTFASIVLATMLTGALAAAGASEAATGTEPYRVGGDVQPPKVLLTVKPVYPEEAKSNLIQGIVILESIVNRDGRVDDVRVLRGHEALREAAVEAVKGWTFEPATLHGEPVPVYFTLSVNFTLRGAADRVDAARTAVTSKPSRGDGTEPYTVDGDVQPPKILKQVKPRYPARAKSRGIQGVVILEAVINRKGRIVDVKILRGHKELHEEAVRAVRRWIFEPGLLDGEPVAVYFTLTVNFKLHGIPPVEASRDEARDVFTRWRSKLLKNEEHLKEGKYKRALKSAKVTIRKMLERMGTGDEATNYLAVAATQRALASAALGKDDDASWYWHVALALQPPVAVTDLKSSGRPGELLATLLSERAAAVAVLPEAIEEPRRIRVVRARLPRGAQALGLRGVVRVTARLSESGVPTEPTVRAPKPGPALTYVALEAFRKWRYAPLAHRRRLRVLASFDHGRPDERARRGWMRWPHQAGHPRVRNDIEGQRRLSSHRPVRRGQAIKGRLSAE